MPATADDPGGGSIERFVDTPSGPARVTSATPSGTIRGRLVLGHGAGGQRWTLDLLAVRDAALAARWVVDLVDQPWRVAGARIGPAPAALDAAWLAVIGSVPRRPGVPLVTGGRSAGARVACRTAAASGADAVLAVSFPLHPPGRPERSRGGELAEPGRHGIPVQVVQGGADPFGTPAEIGAVLPPGGALAEVPGPHALERSADAVAAATAVFLEVVLAGSRGVG
jgi:uncharacterized protein